MDDDTDLIARLLTLAGTITGGTAPVAIVDDGETSVGSRIDLIAMAGSDISSIALAARTVFRRSARAD